MGFSVRQSLSANLSLAFLFTFDFLRTLLNHSLSFCLRNFIYMCQERTNSTAENNITRNSLLCNANKSRVNWKVLHCFTSTNVNTCIDDGTTGETSFSWFSFQELLWIPIFLFNILATSWQREVQNNLLNRWHRNGFSSSRTYTEHWKITTRTTKKSLEPIKAQLSSQKMNWRETSGK